MSKAQNKGYVIKLAAILFAICFIATLLLTLCNYITKDRIEILAAETASKAKAEVIPDAQFTTIELENELLETLSKDYTFVEASKAEINGNFAGYCITVEPQGFGGGINMIVGIKEDMESFYGLKIVSHAETPGLGAKATEKDFYMQYSDNKKGNLETVKNIPDASQCQINAISGATITSEAVTTGANYALEIAKILNEKEAE